VAFPIGESASRLSHVYTNSSDLATSDKALTPLTITNNSRATLPMTSAQNTDSPIVTAKAVDMGPPAVGLTEPLRLSSTAVVSAGASTTSLSVSNEVAVSSTITLVANQMVIPTKPSGVSALFSSVHYCRFLICGFSWTCCTMSL
jgi:hypothetical protein